MNNNDHSSQDNSGADLSHDLADLFDNFAESPSEDAPSPANLEDELNSLFQDAPDIFTGEPVPDGQTGITLEPPGIETAGEPLFELDNLFAAYDEPERVAADHPLIYFDSIDHLEEFINQPSSAAQVDWQALETLIHAPASQATDSLQQNRGATQAKTGQVFATEDIDDFEDLEALLEQTDQSMGGPLTVGGTNATPQLPNRPQKAKVFEQTMRIPIKQLDNLGNLIGELVVNRNSLEQDQKKLRQFLNSLGEQTQKLNDIRMRMQDLYERSLLEASLLTSRGYQQPSGDRQSAGFFAASGANRNVPASNAQPDYDPLEMDQFSEFHLISQEMIELIVRVQESSSDIEFVVDDTEQVSRNFRQVSTQLQEGLTNSRMVPFAQAADRLVRPVREISTTLKKKASLSVEGRDTLIDKMILEQLYDPLTHLINNAITHGIERPEIREANGKPAAGSISLNAFVQGNQIVIAIADDGAGIDAETLGQKAIKKGLITAEELSQLPEYEVYDFIFHPGFSTKDQADDFAGRGVGLDVVRTAMASLRGTITIDTTVGQGTTFTIRLPLTLNICKALCCVDHYAQIALPMDCVEDVQDIGPDQIEEEGETTYITWQGERLPIYPLRDLLIYERRLRTNPVYRSVGDEDRESIVILRSAGNLLAVQIDQVLGEQEIVIKQIQGPFPKPAGIAGATVLGDGSVMPVVDIIELLDIAAQGHTRTRQRSWQQTSAPTERITMTRAELMVLIVDDSITVRELLSMSFAKAGYRVEQARDGQEAWEKLRGGLPCDLVFSDIDMPRMDGLELLSRIQEDPVLSDIPVAMLTSRGSDRHQQMAAEYGASAYFTKPYIEEALLEAARKMLIGEVLLAGSVRQSSPEVDTEQSSQFPVAITPDKESIPSAPASIPLSHVQRQPKALIIDDSVTVRELFAVTFQEAGYLVEKARDGRDALEKLLENADYDVIFCDIEMPRVEGLEFLDYVSQNEQLRKIPIAMLTSRGSERHRKLAAERGAKAFFTKPYVEAQLLQAANRLISGEVLLSEDGTILL